MITRDLRHAIARAVATAGLDTGGPDRAADPGLRPTGTPGQYAASVALALGANPRQTAATLAATLASERWIARAEVTGPGYLTIAVTPEALAAVADNVIAAGSACVTSDALAGVTVPAPPPGDPLTPDSGKGSTWEEARTALAARLTARLAAAAGATIAGIPGTERTNSLFSALAAVDQRDRQHQKKESSQATVQAERISSSSPKPPPGPAAHAQTSNDRATGESGIRSGNPEGEPDANPPLAAQTAASPVPSPLPAAEARPYMSGAPRHDIYGNFMTRGERAPGTADTVRSLAASGVSRPRSAESSAAPPTAIPGGDEPPHPPIGQRDDTDVARAVAFAGRDAVTFTLARAIPGKPLLIDPQIIARHVPGNPAYAVRYAHARAASGVRWAVVSRGGDPPYPPVTSGDADVPPWERTALPGPPADPGELALLDALSWLPERVAAAARRGRPDEFARYLEDLASVTVDVLISASHPGSAPGNNRAPGSDRLTLAMAARTGLAAGLGLLGVAAPERL